MKYTSGSSRRWARRRRDVAPLSSSACRFSGILDAAKHLADRLIALYPTQKEAIDLATSKVYRFEPAPNELYYPFFDVADYAHLLAQETGDAEMKTIAAEMDNAFEEAIRSAN